MHYPNLSPGSLDDNLCDIAIADDQKGFHKKKGPAYPRRVGLLISLSTIPDQKRPSEYYLSRLGLSSGLSSLLSSKRPDSNVSVGSSESCKDSDDACLVTSTPFDVPDSRLSSMTANSVYSNRATDSLEANGKPSFHSIDEHTAEDAEHMAASVSTIVPVSELAMSTSSIADLPKPVRGPSTSIRAASTSSVLDLKQRSASLSAHPALTRQASVSSGLMLTRTKTRFYNAKESRERQQLRKKLYEDNDNDDEIPSNDMSLVFNVPVINNQGEIYKTQRSSLSSSSMLSRQDLAKVDDHSNPYNSTTPMRPCPLPGKLSRSNVNIHHAGPGSGIYENNNIIEEDGSNSSFSFSGDQDNEICQNLSEFYTQRSISLSKLVTASRKQVNSHGIPSYVKNQTSIEDLSLISPEKLEAVDQTRPINLPPKAACDKQKHLKEMSDMLMEYKNSSRTQNTSRTLFRELLMANQQSWLKLMLITDASEFDRKLNYDRKKHRNMNWESLVPEKYRFDYFMRVLRLNAPKQEEAIRQSLALLNEKCNNLSPQMRMSKDAEFDQIIGRVMNRPMFYNFMQEVKTNPSMNFNVSDFRKNFKRMLYLKSMSTKGLEKHHWIFLIPSFLILFQSTENFADIYTSMEMYEACILSGPLLQTLNRTLSKWRTLSKMSSSSISYKILSKFSNLDEFEYLNSWSIFELMIQFNDRLPLSLSAPSTPVISSMPGGIPDTSSPNSKDHAAELTGGALDLENGSVYSKSSSLSVLGVFLQLTIVYSRSKNKEFYINSLIQSFLLTVFQYYHFNWNNCNELVKSNKSIKLNTSSDQLLNLEAFLDKWKTIFKKM